ncbi:alpha/beta fold hydrolase [Streptomyces acidiscabies]|uniref:Alpha/beta fold hydrolase n=1 Tax=Streptomyces acidiscabies TaxID=42234 RepID=A0AAP6B557_9ACTN|nr:alpha/beta fold hydrolase [Streptomyces acidiscabies]MBP5941513.1 alpha/beta hydrolase [Streptomyces sp. LBUM 1476]MBZ3912894.1 alpha/beta fold hydrolase [Streptomyces acidiscabies]MDX2958378.1 alpha/beta fold hydrolase [Streptomyces acidiscabies]MDX3018745.1 alpha/beta fold hydrolase [Streptomyces acidiscabies]MDX3790952.1 alpha/beta fold hydrolase [Streptomyces acidiscabies]
MTDTHYRQPGVVLTDHRFTVPLDHADPSGETISLYAREVVASEKAGQELPSLLYLQGGPGFGAERSVGRPGWLARALREYRVLMLDQRGTGHSTPATRQTLPLRGGPGEQAAYLTHFRADSIVRDCELIRRELTGDAPWTVLGQSYGGFCTVTYLSFAPEGLAAAVITGGLPSLDAHADDVYRAAYPRMERKAAAHYARYPQDAERARRIAAYLADNPLTLPNGGLLTVDGFRTLGILLGGSEGSHRLHHLLEHAFVPTLAGRTLSDEFQENLQDHLSYAKNPLYALVHESIYGQDDRPTAWSADRIRAEFPQFTGTDPFLFTGETIHPWMFDTDPSLRPLKETANLLATRTDWTPLYDRERLARNEVPVAAAIYHDDLYVHTAHSLETARSIKGLRTWVTDEFEHDGVRAGGPRVLDRLLALTRDEV